MKKNQKKNFTGRLKNDRELIMEFEKFLRVNRMLSEGTIRSCSWAVNTLINFLKKSSAKNTLESITQEDISNFLSYLKKDKFNYITKQKGLSTASIALQVSGLRNFYKWLRFKTEKKEITSISFFLNDIIRVKRNQIRSTIIPNTDEIERLRKTLNSWLSQYNHLSNFNRLNTLQMNAVFELLITTGMRAGELRGLILKDINLEKKTVHIRNAKGGRERISSFGSGAKEAIIKWIEKKKTQPEDNLFGIKTNGDLGNRIKLWALKARINPKIHAHSFRHYFITTAQMKGVPVEFVAEQVGHRDLNMTKYYTHFDPDFISSKFENINI